MSAEEWVRPDGQGVRRRRHERGWAPRDLIGAVADASERATGLRDLTITPNLLQGIEERNEEVRYSVLDLLASGLDCDPVDILKIEEPEEEEE